MLLTQLLLFWPAILGTGLVIFFFTNYIHHGLNKYPGPLCAGFSDLWRFVDVSRRRPDITQLRLHRKYGGVVRLGPNVLSFSSPKALKTIYGLNKGFVKSAFYPVQQGVSNGRRLPSLFSTTDEVYHATLRRCVNHAFSMSALVDYEPLVNETIEVFLQQTARIYTQAGKVCDFAEWLQFFTFDVIGQITYGKRHGFIDCNKDVDGMISYLGRLFCYVAPVGQMPWLDNLMLKNPLVLWLDKLGFKPFAFPIATFAKARMAERLATQDIEKVANSPRQRSDLLTMFLKAQTDRPEFMTDQLVLTMAVSMAFAGSETTAISLAALFYYILQDNGRCYNLLIDELNDARKSGAIQERASHLVTWAESQTLPYLNACIQEAFRMHPAAGLPLERVTPPQGVEIDGHFIPGGTIVGCNAWIVHKDKSVFGHHHDVERYIPERWLEADSAQLKEMNGCMFQFGAGARTCIGKNISLLEIYKLVPSFLSNFEIQLANPERSWTLLNAWFVKQQDFHVRFRKAKV